ncbi:MAG: hypothetical protein JXR95_14190 [Deltaproteobacteria bacterium]|nr:hypothetical protein [Deltaproteobacteria bacterium]
MENDVKIKLQRDIRALIHDIRGAVSVISSSIELLQMEEDMQIDQKFLEMIQRQTQKILSVSVLFGENYSPSENSGELIKTDLLGILSDIQEMIGIELDFNYISAQSPFLLKSQPFLLKLALVAVLSSHSTSSDNIFVQISTEEKEISVTFTIDENTELQPRHKWAAETITNMGGRIYFENGTVNLKMTRVDA